MCYEDEDITAKRMFTDDTLVVYGIVATMTTFCTEIAVDNDITKLFEYLILYEAGEESPVQIGESLLVQATDPPDYYWDCGKSRWNGPIGPIPVQERYFSTPQVVADSVRATGTVVDRDTKEPLPFVNVVVKKDGKQVAVAVTDFYGIFTINLPEDTYDLEFTCLGYHRSIWPHVIFPQDMWNRKEPMVMVGDVQQLENTIIEEGCVGPYIELGPDSKIGSEIQGVMLRVQY